MAGKFYPENKKELVQSIESMVQPPAPQKLDALGVMAPHAGYIYSGRIAAQVFSGIKIPKKVIVLCPNHTGRGPKISIWSEGVWETPLGRVPVEEKLAKKFLTSLHLKDGDMLAHLSEHAIEVELPLLQYFQPNITIVPIVLGGLSFQECRRVALALKELIDGEPKGSVLLIASSDMSHYIPAEEALQKDEMALSRIESFDVKGLYEIVLQEDISMCGFIPVTTVLETCLLLGAKSARRTGYSTSGDVTEDFASVVGYAGAVFSA